MSRITKIQFNENKDLNGNPIFSCLVEINGKKITTMNSWFIPGVNVLKIIEFLNKSFVPFLSSKNILGQKEIDKLLSELYKSQHFSYEVIRQITSFISLTIARAIANNNNKTFYNYLQTLVPWQNKFFTVPTPMINIVSGGEKVNTPIDFKDFFIVPIGAENIVEALNMSISVFESFQQLARENQIEFIMSKDGSFVPSFQTNEQVLTFIVESIKKSQLNPSLHGEKAMAIAFDVNATYLFDKTQSIYIYKNFARYKRNHLESTAEIKDVPEYCNTTELRNYYLYVSNKYPILSIENPFDKSQINFFQNLTQNLGRKLDISISDINISNPAVLSKILDNKITNTISISISEIGTISNLINIATIAKKNNSKIILSNLEDGIHYESLIDISVALNIDYLKISSIADGANGNEYIYLKKLESDILEALQTNLANNQEIDDSSSFEVLNQESLDQNDEDNDSLHSNNSYETQTNDENSFVPDSDVIEETENPSYIINDRPSKSKEKFDWGFKNKQEKITVPLENEEILDEEISDKNDLKSFRKPDLNSPLHDDTYELFKNDFSKVNHMKPIKKNNDLIIDEDDDQEDTGSIHQSTNFPMSDRKSKEDLQFTPSNLSRKEETDLNHSLRSFVKFTSNAEVLADKAILQNKIKDSSSLYSKELKEYKRNKRKFKASKKFY